MRAFWKKLFLVSVLVHVGWTGVIFLLVRESGGDVGTAYARVRGGVFDEVAGEEIPMYEAQMMIKYFEGRGVEDAHEFVWEKMARGIFVKQVAEELGVRVSGPEPEAILNSALDLGLSEEVARRWLLEPYLLEQELAGQIWRSKKAEVIMDERENRVQGQLNEGVAFADLSVQYSEDSSAIIGGDLGLATNARLEALDLNGVKEHVLVRRDEDGVMYLFYLEPRFENVMIEEAILDDEGVVVTPEVWEEVEVGVGVSMIEMSYPGLEELLDWFIDEERKSAPRGAR